MLARTVLVIASVSLSYGYLLNGGVGVDITRTVSTPVGDIVGVVQDVPINSSFSYKVQKYRGIPYAEAPTGSLRFKKPIPKAAFKTPFDAKQDGFTCYQKVSKGFEPSRPMSEDCLMLNVFVPGDGSDMSNSTSLKPVMIWIHGGGFILGESYVYDASVLSTVGDVIVVTINYRLAFYGFISTRDSVMPGNLGLWDQHLAIKWVHDNIHAFGGDTSKVTIFGESAGSASVVYQTFYPGNKGLFQRAIAESGSLISYWAYNTSDNVRSLSMQFAEQVGCTDTDSVKLHDCLSSVPISLLNEIVQKNPYVTPMIDYDFVLDHPSNIVSDNTNASSAIDMFLSVDLIMGFNSADGLVEVGIWVLAANGTDKDNFTISKELFEKELVPQYVQKYFHNFNISDVAIAEAVHVYTDWSDPSNDIKRLIKLVDISTDTSFAVPAIRTANLHTNGSSNTYMYEFLARTYKRMLPVPNVLEGPTVANHGDDLEYVFGIQITHESEDKDAIKEYTTTQAVMTLWTNFAKTGDPNKPEAVARFVNVDWRPYTDHESYLAITLDMDQNSTKTRPKPAAMNLWNDLLPRMEG